MGATDSTNAPSRRVATAPSRAQFLAIRGLAYHVRTWGDPRARKLVLLHGWMDVSASFQFVVDELAGSWCVLAPDWRGFGLTETPQDGYWFADYVADLDALVRALAGDAPPVVVGHSLGGNVALAWAGARPHGASHVVTIDAFGIPAEPAAHAPAKLTRWLDALRDPPGFTPYVSLGAVADRLQKTNPRLPRDKAEFLAAHWAQMLPDGSARLRADPRHKRPFPSVARIEEMEALWASIAVPVLGIVAAQSNIGSWLAPGGDVDAEIARRFRWLRQGRLAYVDDAGHMVHHDQPRAVARLIEEFAATAR
ncbi:MAG: alpha/beta hydrolase [Burkholderiales bacterium]|nr:alpha/beta hydrolase [Burkholderiales bacterium]